MPISTRHLLSALIGLLISWGSQAAEVTVSAASSLTQAFKEIAPLYESAYRGAKVRLNFGASGALLQQVAKGAPVDVFASADQETMDQAQALGLLKAGSRRDLASNTLVVIVPVVVPVASARSPRTLADLAGAGYGRIAIGLPASVPVGRYAKGVLEAAKLWDVIEPRLIGATTVRQALDYVARGEVDAGFVYATDAALMPDKVKVALTVPTARPIVYPVAALAGSPNPVEAARFIDFLQTAPAQAVLARHGFGKP